MCTSTLIIDIFNGGSHKVLTDWLCKNVLPLDNREFTLLSLPAKKWHWRARAAALAISEKIPSNLDAYGFVFTTSVLNLSELVSLRPDLQRLRKIVYFHENQLVYPTISKKSRRHDEGETSSNKAPNDRDFQFGYNQIFSCLAGDIIIFNSFFNMSSFLDNIEQFLNKMPKDQRPNSKQLIEKIRSKSSVLYFPICFPPREVVDISRDAPPSYDYLHIVWPHRWEHDKNPELFFRVVDCLVENKVDVRLSVLGQSFSDVPSVFAQAYEKHSKLILNWGHLDSKEDYFRVLSQADVVVSTSNHEFFGVAMLEAAWCGCFVLAPNRLSYPEIFPKESPQSFLYNTEAQLIKRLSTFRKVKPAENVIDFDLYDANKLTSHYQRLIFGNKP